MPIVVIDTETTGHAGDSRSSVVEVGAVCLSKTGQELGIFSAFVRPPHPLGSWADYAMGVNQIDPLLLLGAASADEVWKALLSWMSLHKPIQQVLAFNAPFDKGMMARTFPASQFLPWGPCLMRSASERIKGNRASIKLVDAARALGVQHQFEQGHRALTDARMAARLWTALQD